MNPIQTAEQQIQRILRQLEQDTGMRVAYIAIEEIDCTTLIDESPTFVRTVEIQMSSTKWSLASE